VPALRSFVPGAWGRLRSGPHPDRARQDAETLLLNVLGQSKAWFLAHLDDDFPEDQAQRFGELVERRYRGEPIQYILGEAEFYGLPFRVTPAVLIPRPETEHLVEEALQVAASFPQPRILDIGTGSGAIAIAVASALKGRGIRRTDEANQTIGAFQAAEKGRVSDESSQTHASGAKAQVGFTALAARLKSCPDASSLPEGVFPQPVLAHEGPTFCVTAVDLSPEALAIARENAERNGVSIRFLQGDLLAPVEGEQFHLILSNPPYIPATDRPTLSVEVRDHEPALALFAGDDGLGIYRRLIPAAFEHLVPGGFLLLEIGYGQQADIEMLLAASGFAAIEFIPDLQGIARVACARRAVAA